MPDAEDRIAALEGTEAAFACASVIAWRPSMNRAASAT